MNMDDHEYNMFKIIDRRTARKCTNDTLDDMLNKHLMAIDKLINDNITLGNYCCEYDTNGLHYYIINALREQLDNNEYIVIPMRDNKWLITWGNDYSLRSELPDKYRTYDDIYRRESEKQILCDVGLDITIHLDLARLRLEILKDFIDKHNPKKRDINVTKIDIL